MTEQADKPDPRTDGELITAVAYSPRSETRTRRFPLSGWQLGAIGVAVPVLAVIWFLFSAKSVRVEFTPPAVNVQIKGGPSLEVGDVYLLLAGDYRVLASADGHHPLDEPMTVTSARNQTHQFTFTRLPGRVRFTSEPEHAQVLLDGKALGHTPMADIPVPAGPNTFVFTADRYQPLTEEVEIVGLDQTQTVHAELQPDWAEVSISSEPAGAEIFIDDIASGQTTPAVVEVLSGEHEIRIKAPGHRSHRQRILVAALEAIAIPTVKLQRADGLLVVDTTPRGAGVTLNGRFQGETPLEIAVRSGTSYRLQVFKAGYAPRETTVTVASGAERAIALPLTRLTGQLIVHAEPADAQLFVNGQSRGPANQTVTLPTESHQIDIKLDGYAGYSTQITPRNGLAQELKVRLLTLEEARLAALKPVIQTSQGQELVLLRPTPFTMGASRRQPGRRANETLHEVSMGRLFYLGRNEVTNAQFRAFASGHDSGEFQEHDLNEDAQPAVNVSWEEAALYCNWLSKRDALPAFYRTDLGKVVGIDPSATGYRLPTEAEWAWSARQNKGSDDSFRFPWGANLPPPDRHGNYADRSASHMVGRVVFGYNDNHIVAAEVGTFAPNEIGVYDLSGNVAEWVNDFYEIPSADPASDPLGPDSGEYHVIRGSSWMHGTITDLRVSYRDYGIDGRMDVGFRIARFAEAQ